MIDSEFKRKVKDFVQKNREDIVADIKDLVSINSVQGSPEENAPYGRGPKKALEKILEISKKNGLSVKNLDNRTGYAQIDGKVKNTLLLSPMLMLCHGATVGKPTLLPFVKSTVTLWDEA